MKDVQELQAHPHDPIYPGVYFDSIVVKGRTDGLKGLPEAINAVFPYARFQLCIIHMIINSTKHVSWKERKIIYAYLKIILGTPSEKVGSTLSDDFKIVERQPGKSE